MEQTVNLIHPETKSKVIGTITDDEYAMFIAEGYVKATDETPIAD